MKKTTAEIHQELLDKELSSFKHGCVIEPPGYFSPVPTLTSNQKMGEVIKIFPKPGKFSGTMKEGHLPVAEFLTLMNAAQEQCGLSKVEFLSRMQAASTGLAHELIMDWRQNGERPATIYHSLLLNFDKRANPDEARTQLHTFKINKNSSLTRLRVP